ncbi:TPA: arginase family protein [Pseudomonas aeruginosa]
MNTHEKSIQLVVPLWQGGNNPAYSLGAKLLDWLSPQTDTPVFHVPIKEPAGPLPVEDDMTGRTEIKDQLAEIWKVIRAQQPDSIVTLGGDCLVSLAPFAWLSEKYGEKLGVLWIDSHPDIQTPTQYHNAHAHVLGALLGHGDPDLTASVCQPIPARNVMIAGIHDPLAHEAQFLAEKGIVTCSPEEVKRGGEAIMQWIEAQGIEFLAIHLDLDVLDPQNFRSVLFARPGRGKDDFGGVAEGRLDMSDVVTLVRLATEKARPVGLTIAEHLPWDAINLKGMLESLPLLGTKG